MRVLFIEVDDEREWAVASIGPAFIGALLRTRGHEVRLLRVALDADLDEAARQAALIAPALIGLSLTTRQWLRARDVASALRARLDVPLIAGGLHPTFAPEQVLATPGFDYVCLGEGEQAMLELVTWLEDGGPWPAGGIANIWRHGDARPALRPPFEPVDALPFMARDLLDERHGVAHMVTQRGCPFPCTYCGARQLADLYPGGYADYGRRRSLATVLREAEAVRAAGALNYVIFLDDTFTIQHAWVRDFCRAWGERVQVPFSLHARAETVNERLLGALAAAGCRHVVYGVESGSERVRREVMRRHVSDRRLIDAFRWTREAGILATANYIIGTPGETATDIERTLALHERLAPDDFGCFVFYPYPGTALFRMCLEQGLLPDDWAERRANHRTSILRLPDLTPEQVQHYYARFSALRERDQVRRLGAAGAAHAARIAADNAASVALG